VQWRRDENAYQEHNVKGMKIAIIIEMAVFYALSFS
jgi:hypothetical protein